MKRKLFLLLAASLALSTLTLGCGDNGNGGSGGNNGGNQTTKPKEGEPCTANLACDSGLTCVLVANSDPQLGVCTKFTGSTCAQQSECSGETPNCVTYHDLTANQDKSVCTKSCSRLIACADAKYTCIGEKTSHYRSGTCEQLCNVDTECSTSPKTKCERLGAALSPTAHFGRSNVCVDPNNTPESKLNTPCDGSAGQMCPSDYLCAKQTPSSHGGWCTIGCAKAMANAPDCPPTASTCVSMTIIKNATETETKLACVPARYAP